MTWMALLIVSYIPTDDGILRDRVDLVEVNHYHDERGRKVFDQIIFYDWSDQRKRFQVRAWRLIKSERQLPRRDWRAGVWRVTWHDNDVLRQVLAKSYRETWTKHDPEILDRDRLPQNQRRDLTRRFPSPAALAFALSTAATIAIHERKCYLRRAS